VTAARADPAAGAQEATLDVERIRRDFPILKTLVHGKPLVYLDNAATTQKPQSVISALKRYYEAENSNVHRGVHHLSELATREFEGARGKVARFIHANATEEIVFTRGATEAINLVANSFVRPRLRPGDEVIVSTMEHHSNIVPWQMACEATGAHLKAVPITDAGEFRFDEYLRLLGPRTKFVSVTHVSNALGTVNPVKRIVDAAKGLGVPVLLDGAQAVPHAPVDVRALGCDFYAFSGHKMYGPTGIGALWGKRDHLEAMPPWQGGGDMIRSVTFEKTTYNDVPFKFEAGTPNIAGAIGLGAAVDYLAGIGMQAVQAHERDLLEYATQRLAQIPGIRILGTAKDKAAVLSFIIEGAHPHDVGSLLDRDGIAVRTGHHCAQPVMDRYGVPATSRASFGVYNTRGEVDVLAEGVAKVAKMFG
jgi:cysteine desulfurase / selenocysteine lyase